MTELAAPQISSLMEALPGIAAVLRSPVASAMASLVRAGAGLEEFSLTDAEELLKFGVRRNLLTQEEVDRLLDEAREVVARRPAKPGATADTGAKGSKPRPTPAAAVAQTVASVPAKVSPVKVVATPPKPPAKPAAVRVAHKSAVQAPRAGTAAKPSPRAPVVKAAGRTLAKAAVKAAVRMPAKSRAKSPVKAPPRVVRKAKTVAKGSKPGTKKAPHKAPAKKVVAKRSPKKRR